MTSKENMLTLTDGVDRSGKALIDALPYVDDEVRKYARSDDDDVYISRTTQQTHTHAHTIQYNLPGMKEYVAQLVKEEMGRFTPPDYLEKFPTRSLEFTDRNPVLKNEFERMNKNIPMKPFDVSRYKLEKPTGKSQKDPEAWKACVRNAEAQLEHQSNRILNLKLLKKYGADKWKSYNAALASSHREIENKVKECSEDMNQINRKRKVSQEGTRNEFARLQAEYWIAIDRNAKTYSACEMYEREVKKLRLMKKGE